ncbi:MULTISPECIES: MerR family transcriptional regulator [Marinobacter]|jgi:DNA-binding transcriptional MerR regulator|uniref:Putative transcriptional regulator, MerR family n=6 Tax=Marinobacter TaxID=2742 RepID=A1U0I4_MARN8|nr:MULTISPECIES: MerR family transcriptional regulator [Marinobacter]MEC9041537.1 MerR family transcriptional regulator [Pseudomonadota bacterium]ABM18503.1 putative transcriptional regulator, MerR family [Marinobacter nauticus VT8]MAC24028.1 MerR family transcriptional regulator [Marinobacter sp.]MEC9083643.1 MerR family transcriptional regulator [Pseudomonadota bacterium]MEC9387117.1 MerR family transcriptional regulator [Pseudomonadota bacterium]|tara:strand:+ start:1326 stop:1853 length:528 start_codon:yes stop_codon:yes gene_type:complete
MLAFSPLIYRDLFHASDVGTMKVNEIANLADVSPDTVRFYNREGLLRPRKDPRNGYNLYNSEDLWRLRFVRVANKLGFNLREVKVILSHGTEGGLAGSDLKELFTDRLCRLDQELKELKRLRDDMKTTVQVWRQMPDGAPNGHSVQEFSRAPTSVYAYIFGLKISERAFILGRPI